MKRAFNLRVATALLICGFILVATSHAEDYKSAHHVEPGDVISAEVINELFDKIADSQRTITADDLVGIWKGGSYGLYSGPGAPWFNDPANSCWALTNAVVTISKVASNYYELRTSAPDPFSTISSGRTNRVAVIEGTLFGIDPQTLFTIDRIGPNRIRLSSHHIWANITKLLTLDRQNTPPEQPKLLSADVTGKKVKLVWQDNSTDETGFTILRRDSLSGSYSNIAAVGANNTSWTNASLTSGIYWYRVASTNDNGSSLGSNVKRVTVP